MYVCDSPGILTLPGMYLHLIVGHLNSYTIATFADRARIPINQSYQIRGIQASSQESTGPRPEPKLIIRGEVQRAQTKRESIADQDVIGEVRDSLPRAFLPITSG